MVGYFNISQSLVDVSAGKCLLCEREDLNLGPSTQVKSHDSTMPITQCWKTETKDL